MMQFLFGSFVGAIVISVFWLAYLAFFPDDASSMGGRIRRWVRKKRGH
jgi:hypothetical protein